LLKIASLVAASLWGLRSLPTALAYGGYSNTGSSIRPRAALIIDDIGYSHSRARQFLELKVPITFSILPLLAKSYDLALEFHYEGHEIMLHQPMEPYSPDLDPGPGALYVGYEAERIACIMNENISGVPFAVGVNNHMGSRLTECRPEMSEVIKIINKKCLFFVDSLTSSRSEAYKIAKKLRVSAGCRNIFLDNNPDESAIIYQLHKLNEHALKHSRAIGIGHPYPVTARAINRALSRFEESGVSLVHVSQVLNDGC
ncbi:MAG: divergent polysaccharide deacetylase family protein, partial [Thermodesulfobacteriota bacterium]|nr:divergent polysaccharide deacetylase family protein [Thermodesulfobacteriota bacterium]